VKQSWEQEVASAADLVAYHHALATAGPQEARVHVLAQKAGELLWAALGTPSLHHVYALREEFTDGANFIAIEPGTRNTRNYDDVTDPQGKATVHAEVHAAVTVYGDRKDGKARFALIGGDHSVKDCVEMLDKGNRFFLVASDSAAEWLRPGAANALKRIVLLEWQALSQETHRDWRASPDSARGRIARLAYAAWMYRCIVLQDDNIPPKLDGDAYYLPSNGFRLSNGKPIPMPMELRRGVVAMVNLRRSPTDAEREAAWDTMTAPLRQEGETWTLRQVEAIARRSREIRVNAPPQLIPLKVVADKRYRRLSLMQFLTHHLCDAEDGPRLARADAAEWLRTPESQVRTHASRANAKLAKASQSGRTRGDRAAPNRAAGRRKREVNTTSKSTTPPPNGPSQTGNKSGGGRGNNAPAPKGK
jgi:hypothetical protein